MEEYFFKKYKIKLDPD